MKITVLGSGCAIPTKKRHTPSLLLETDKLKLLLDIGADTLRQLLKVNLNYQDIDKIMITHCHPDHIAGLCPFIFASQYEVAPRTKDLKVCGPKGIRKFYKDLNNTYDNLLTPKNYNISIEEKGNSQFNIEDLKIQTLKLEHTKEAIGYRITDKKGKKIVYSGDTDYCENLIRLSKDADLLITECSFPDKIKVKGHLTPKLAAKAAQAAKVKRLLLVHLYPIHKKEDIIKSIKTAYSGDFDIASDLMNIKI
jgi:ribonuclease BN (tRNA processing enzyme)